ncbi:MAG: DUF5803 family protein [Salinigranum sp.]
MRRRLLLPVAALVLIALTAGCAGVGSGPIQQSTLDAKPAAPYAWDAQATVHVTVQDNAKFRAVYHLDQRSIQLYRRDGFGGRSPLDVRAVRYRYPNGTIINGSEFASRGGGIQRTRDVVNVTLPSDASGGGKLAFTADSMPKRFSLPTFVKGSYEVVLPPNRRIDVPVLGTASPSPSRVSTVGSRTHIYWNDVSGRTISVQFYLQRDLLVFGAIVAALGLVGIGGLAFYRRQIRRLREQREEMGLDVEDDDDVGRGGPPPGMG